MLSHDNFLQKIYRITKKFVDNIVCISYYGCISYQYKETLSMPRKKLSGPTEKELAILAILWEHGACTVREVNTFMNRENQTGYTTTLKLMQIMHDKGLLKRDASQRTHVYCPANSEESVQTEVVGNLLDRVFAGSTEKLLMRILSSQQVSVDELSSLKKMIESKEKEIES